MTTLKGNIMTTLTLVELTKINRATIQADNLSQSKWLDCGIANRVFYGSEEVLKEQKKQFCADMIIPALDSKTRAHLDIDVKLTDKDSPEGIKARDDKKKAIGMVNSYFSRIMKYAFPTEKAETAPREPSLAFVEDLIKVAKKGMKLEAAEFDLVEAMRGLNIALKACGVTISSAD